MARTDSRSWRIAARIAALGAALVMALVAPIPSTPDTGRAAVADAVGERLPGWTIQRLDPSWEGAYTVVTSCAGHQLGFQYVPGHGLRPSDAWIQPNDAYARDRLTELSDHRRYLIWYGHASPAESLSCRQELARSGDDPIIERNLD